MNDLSAWTRACREMARRRDEKILADAPARLVQLKALGSMARDQIHTLILGMRQRVISCTLETPGKARDDAFYMVLAEMSAEIEGEIISLSINTGRMPDPESINELGARPNQPDD